MIIEHGQYLHLQGKNVSYILRIHEKGYLLHHYFGRKLRTNDYITLFTPITPTRFFWRKKSRNIRLLGISI